MRDFAQILAKTLGILFLVFFPLFSVSAQSAIRLVVPVVSDYECFNGIDDDNDGSVDYPLDADCTSEEDNSESVISATCSPSFSRISVGQSVDWSVSATGGNGTYVYIWSGTDLAGDTAQLSKTYTTSGIKTASVTITSGAYSTTIDCVSLTVDDSSIPDSHRPSGDSSGNSAYSLFAPLVSSPSRQENAFYQQTVPDDIDLQSAPEETDSTIEKNIPPEKIRTPLVKLRTQVRLTLRDEGRMALTNEPVPAPPRVDNLPLFDVISELSGISMNIVNGGLLGKVAPGELLPVSVKLLNVSGTRRLDVQVYYSVLSAGGESVYSSSETVAVETTASFVKMVQIPYYLMPGVYTVRVSIKYDGQTVPATSHFPFTVEPKIGGIFRTTLLSYAVIFVLLTVLMAGSIIFFRKKYHQTSRSSPMDYSHIPNNMRTFYEIISDTIMDMRQRVGDQAISIANSIDGLKIDVESGRVLSLSQNPSKIIAELVSKYEIELGKKVSFSFRQKEKTQ